MWIQFKLEKQRDKGQWIIQWANTEIYNLIKEHMILLWNGPYIRIWKKLIQCLFNKIRLVCGQNSLGSFQYKYCVVFSTFFNVLLFLFILILSYKAKSFRHFNCGVQGVNENVWCITLWSPRSKGIWHMHQSFINRSNRSYC